jgi:hypothetical protein
MATQCTIEHHATLFGLMSKHAINLRDEEGKKAILKAMTLYGNERGQRMAKNALSNGDPINLFTNQAYGEWKPDYDGQMVFGITHGEPTLQTYIAKCAWCDAWKKHGLTEYGKYYCVDVDNAVYQGYQDKYECRQESQSMSWGGDCCRFDWGAPLNERELDALKEKKQQLGTKYMKDFNFHTAHIKHTIGNTLIEELGDDGKKAVELALKEYASLFGQDYLDVLDGLY